MMPLTATAGRSDAEMSLMSLQANSIAVPLLWLRIRLSKKSKEAGTRRELAADILIKLVDLTAATGFLELFCPRVFWTPELPRRRVASFLSKCQLLEIATLPGGVFLLRCRNGFVLSCRSAAGVLRFYRARSQLSGNFALGTCRNLGGCADSQQHTPQTPNSGRPTGYATFRAFTCA